jgi:hypothetical protein
VLILFDTQPVILEQKLAPLVDAFSDAMGVLIGAGSSQVALRLRHSEADLQADTSRDVMHLSMAYGAEGLQVIDVEGLSCSTQTLGSVRNVELRPRHKRRAAATTYMALPAVARRARPARFPAFRVA